MSASCAEQWEALVCDAFPEFANRLSCFGYDWLGRIFALDSARIEKSNPGVLLLEPGTGEGLEIPCDLQGFHIDEMVEHQEEALAMRFHARWLSDGGSAPKRGQCVGYKKTTVLRRERHHCQFGNCRYRCRLDPSRVANQKGKRNAHRYSG